MDALRLPQRRAAVIAAAFSVVLGAAAAVHGQAIPNAGSTLRELVPAPGSTLAPTPRTTPTTPESAPQALATGPTMVVRTFTFEGNKRYTAGQLSVVLRHYLNRPLHFSDLESAAAVITRYYRRKGWLVRVLVPPQTIQDGQVRLRVIEAVYGKAEFDDAGSKSQLMSATRIIDRVQARQQPGDPLNVSDVERGVLIANDTPGVAIVGSQIAGDNEGETNILLKGAEVPRLFGNVALDNFNSRTLGAERLTGQLGINSPFGFGEEFDAQTQLAFHLRYFRLAASTPLGNDGLRLLANVSTLHYTIGTAQFHALGAYGDMNTAGAGLNYPVLRANDHNLSINLGVERRDPYNSTVLGTISNYHVNNLVLQFNGNWIDPFGGADAGGLTAVRGQVSMGGSPNQATDAAGPDTQGSFTVLRYQLSRTTPLVGPLALYLLLHGQTTNRNLDSSEEMYLGGPSGVRAYPVNEAGGASGVMLNVELRWALPANSICACTLAPLFDWGEITQYEQSFVGEPAPNHYTLQGVGLSVGAQGPWGTSLSLSLSHRLGGNPAALPNGDDQDGSLDKFRVWAALSASL